ncbi:hypothetical protein AJ79_05854 [Helicocarpus griseus UAMH5409]|uniref:Amidase domain-containing protein n=1 Tax=Helicocarpus griseus UAMH5409 TaxID=1447875 RepID=A0A2B7XIU6_9EURO|nr:hypothetical protein AJ79_05854 [Helicocarpus griseus UAMH5409]
MSGNWSMTPMGHDDHIWTASTSDCLHLKSDDGQFLTVALPSRIKTQAISDLPIAGWRVLVKDNIHLQGAKSSLGNKAFYETYPPQPETAECIKRLIGRGVVILGKTKMSSFGNWEEPIKYTDYQAPWNPRGDRYQSPGASSSGSAAAVASYDWLDIAIGTGTWGSVTRPSLWCRCFGLRVRIGTVSTKGVEPCISAWDIPGLLGRDLGKCREFASAWLLEEALVKSPEPFSVLWKTDFWKIVDHDQCKLAQQFIKDIELYLGLKQSEISFEEAWSESPPFGAAGLLLPDYINPQAMTALAYDAYHNRDDFRERYWNKFHANPYTTRPNQEVWTVGKMISKEDLDEAFERVGVYQRWFRNTILTEESTNALIVLPLENVVPRYRDELPMFKRPSQDGISALSLGPVMKSPVLAVPSKHP